MSKKLLFLIIAILLILPGCSKEEKSDLDTIVFSQSEDGNFVISPSGNEKTYADILALYQSQWEEYYSTKLSYVERENVFALEDVALPAYGSIYPGQNTEEVMDAIYQGSENYKSISDKGYSGLIMTNATDNYIPASVESERVGLAMTGENEGNLYISGIYGDHPFEMSLSYVTEAAENETENKLAEIDLNFISVEDGDKLFYMWTDIRNRLISQLGEPPRKPPYQDEPIFISAEELMDKGIQSGKYGINWMYKNYTLALSLSFGQEGTPKAVQLVLITEF